MSSSISMVQLFELVQYSSEILMTFVVQMPMPNKISQDYKMCVTSKRKNLSTDTQKRLDIERTN